jgi:hypothetical protein
MYSSSTARPRSSRKRILAVRPDIEPVDRRQVVADGPHLFGERIPTCSLYAPVSFTWVTSPATSAYAGRGLTTPFVTRVGEQSLHGPPCLVEAGMCPAGHVAAIVGDANHRTWFSPNALGLVRRDSPPIPADSHALHSEPRCGRRIELSANSQVSLPGHHCRIRRHGAAMTENQWSARS